MWIKCFVGLVCVSSVRYENYTSTYIFFSSNLNAKENMKHKKQVFIKISHCIYSIFWPNNKLWFTYIIWAYRRATRHMPTYKPSNNTQRCIRFVTVKFRWCVYLEWNNTRKIWYTPWTLETLLNIQVTRLSHFGYVTIVFLHLISHLSFRCLKLHVFSFALLFREYERYVIQFYVFLSLFPPSNIIMHLYCNCSSF